MFFIPGQNNLGTSSLGTAPTLLPNQRFFIPGQNNLGTSSSLEERRGIKRRASYAKEEENKNKNPRHR